MNAKQLTHKSSIRITVDNKEIVTKILSDIIVYDLLNFLISTLSNSRLYIKGDKRNAASYSI